MYELPSTSKMYEPSPRSMNRGSPPTERNARTGLFTPPGIRLTARSMSRAERSMARIALASMSLLLPCKRVKPPSRRLIEVYTFWPVAAVRGLTRLGEPAGDLRGIVGDDDIRAGALYARERLQNHGPLVEPAILRGGLYHGVLPAHAVSRDGEVC